MQLTKTLKVTPEELFDALAGSIMQDIENATGKRPSRNKLNGYKYEKRAQSAKGKAKGTAIKVKIKHFDYPCLYEVRFQYAAGINTMRYEAAPAGDGASSSPIPRIFRVWVATRLARAASLASSSMSASSRATPTRRLIKSSNTSRVSAA
ncbi:MAG: DUF3284 domain-containing protein [Collinsella sp.]